LAEGNLYTARKLANNQLSDGENFALYRDWMRLCYKYDVVLLNNWVNTVAKIGRERQKSFLNYALRNFHQSISINYIENHQLPIQGEELVFLQKFAPFVNTANVIQLNDEVNKAIAHIERNANATILFMDLSLQVARMLRMKPE
jgi:DNA polymerase-3 subunit delta'